jgi:site-specific recombinase XerD
MSFINLFVEPRGQAWSNAAAYDLVIRRRTRTGLDFDSHWFRHSAATGLRDGVPIDVVSTLLGHSSVAVTSSVCYNRRELHQSGEKPQVSSSRQCRNSVSYRRTTAV